VTGAKRSGPRIRPLAEPDPDVAEVLSKTPTDDRGAPLNLFATVAHHPRLLRRFNALGGLFLVHGQLPARERELVILRTAWLTGSEYEWGHHVVIGRRAGLTDEEIARVTRPEEAHLWLAEDHALLRFADEILEDADVSSGTWQVQRQRWSDAQLIELVLLVGFYRMVAGFLKALRVQREDELPEWPAGHDLTPEVSEDR
jgi:4-carboxymuconolactone decarboxylase